MIIENLTTLKINKLTQAQYDAALSAGTLSENELYLTPSEEINVTEAEKTSWNEKQNKPTIVNTTLSASSWDATTKTYSFETTYPNANYNLEVEINGDSCTDEQLEAWSAAKPLSSMENKINAKGDVPTIDIPVILMVVEK